jgi:hypothetical protein
MDARTKTAGRYGTGEKRGWRGDRLPGLAAQIRRGNSRPDLNTPTVVADRTTSITKFNNTGVTKC